MSIRIMLNGRAGSGKDSVADYLVQKYQFKKIFFAQPIYEIAYKYFGMIEKDRALLQSIGQKMREIKPTVWLDYAYDYAQEFDNVVISDVRQENEYIAGINNYFCPIRINSTLENRIFRLRKRDGIEPDQSLFENECETGADNFFYHEIDNNGTFEDLYKQVDKIINDWQKYLNIAKK